MRLTKNEPLAFVGLGLKPSLFEGCNVEVVRTPAALEGAFASSDKPCVVFRCHADRLLHQLVEEGQQQGRVVRRPWRLLMWEPASRPTREGLRAFFDEVLAPDPVRLIPTRVFREVLRSKAPEDLFIGAATVPTAKTVVLYRGNLERIVVPWAYFRGGPHSPKPDFGDVEIIDGGQTVRLGHFEASAEAILYELDADFRRKLKKRRLAEDRGFGASLRRLRLQRGLGREDFPGISAKEIARLERSEVKKPHGHTLTSICKTLKVEPDEIESY